ncbi:MAG: serine--tRNA ligase [Algisphaera sp.]
MIDLNDLRANPEKYRLGAAHKNSSADVDALLVLDEQVRSLQTQRQTLAAEKNALSKQMGPLMGKLKKATGDEKIQLEAKVFQLRERPQALKEEQAALDTTLTTAEADRRDAWLSVPQPADDDVPVGKGAQDNVECGRWNPDAFDPNVSFETQRGFQPKTHLELVRDLGLVDFERGVKIAGSRSYVLTGDGMRLHQAALRFAFDFMTQENGFTPLSASCLVKHDTMVGTGFFPGGRDQVYDVANPTSTEGLALTGTGEVGLMAYHADEILDAATLPRCYTTVSTCFRREAGAAGKDSAGLYRVHQFDKVEQVVICEANETTSREWHTKMIGFVETLLQKLGLPHRRLQCCTGDLGSKNADMIDLECWMPGRAVNRDGDFLSAADPGGELGWGETHSASRLYDYQTRRLNLRYRDPSDPKGKKTLFCHSLNNTVAASPRLLVPLLEMYQNADGTVTVPEVLRPYLGGQERIG